MKFSASTEAMAAVTSSKLGTELEGLFQEVINYRDNELKGISFDNKVSAIQTFFAKKTAKRFMDCVWKHTGLNIEATFFKPHFETSFCTWMCYGKGDDITDAGTREIEGALTGQAGNLISSWFDGKEFSVTELLSIAKSFDVEKGIIRPEMREKMKKWIRCAMGFDLSLGFLAPDYLPKDCGVEYMTARELTACMLHEIGHNLTMVEHAADMYAHVSSFKSLRAAFTEVATPEKAIELGKRVADMASKAGFVQDANKLANVANQAEKDLGAAGKYVTKEAKKNFIAAMIGSAFTILADVGVRLADVCVCDPSRKFLRTKEGQNKKLGDVLVNERMWTWQERKADEFAFSHGYATDLAEGLEKIGKFYSFIGRTKEDIEAILKAEADNKNLSLYTKLRLSTQAHYFMHDEAFRSYPPGSERYRELLKLTIKEMKTHGASATYINKYIADAERIMNLIDNMSKEDKYFEEAIQSYKVFLKFTSIRSFVSWFVHGRVDTELVETLDNIQRLNNNLITYFGVKFSQLANKKV